ncbi:MAG: oxygen-independent coproporphyrinogen III oxidase [Crocinitomicaceae bacterium]|nr:oxygen-independent coproporphyrinogen III oxidase [Crocinitomicaceae bacterium]|tara:strand:- start:20603 stop:21967 length:1365 start_codon:yes stop_codon:yes gene_type:complete
MNKSLIRKYNVAGPRYTSYPTVPYWDGEEGFDISDWKSSVTKTFEATNAEEGISLYIHLPFCERLCHFCGCNKKITRQHSVEEPYVSRVLKEWDLYCEFLPQKPRLKEMHLGGGTPTFLSAENLHILISGILSKCDPVDSPEFSFEAHPNSTTYDKMLALYKLGFKRLSLGVQDFDIEVQRVINRYQSFEEVKKVSDEAREIGYTSINYDLIFGLPKQTQESIEYTIKKTIELKPDRIAYYSYAHVPWLSRAQRLYSDEDLPSNEFKRSLYELGKELLEKEGYLEIGMDHFALPEEDLSLAMKNKLMHRNFMGYTTVHTELMIGLGVSSIGDSWGAFGQNVKALKEYERIIDRGELPLFRGHFLNEEDLVLRRHILNLMCHFKTSWTEEENNTIDFQEICSRLVEMEEDGLCTIEPNGLTVTEKGQGFVRNICMAFDLRMYRKAPSTELFSQTI